MTRRVRDKSNTGKGSEVRSGVRADLSVVCRAVDTSASYQPMSVRAFVTDGSNKLIPMSRLSGQSNRKD